MRFDFSGDYPDGKKKSLRVSYWESTAATVKRIFSTLEPERSVRTSDKFISSN